MSKTLLFQYRRLPLLAGLLTCFFAAASPSLAQQLVKDIYPGLPGSAPAQLTEARGTLFFESADATHGRELWKSDGTATGTTLVKDIRPGADSAAVSEITAIGKTVYFIADDGNSGRELWKSDGTTAGTVLVKDINPGKNGSAPSRLVEVNGILYFVAHDGVHGNELWKSDGTAAGTTLVRDINPGKNGSDPALFTTLNGISGTIFFSANDGTHGTELWKSNGTAAGTTLIRDITPGSAGSDIASTMTYLNGKVYFDRRIYDAEGLVAESQIWVSNGTNTGTTLLQRFPVQNLNHLTSFQGYLYFGLGDAVEFTNLYRSDGTSKAPVYIRDFPYYFTNLKVISGKLCAFGIDELLGTQIWVSSTGNPNEFLLINPRSSIYGGLEGINGSLYYIGEQPLTYSNAYYQILKTDGQSVEVINENLNDGDLLTNLSPLKIIGSTIYFQAVSKTLGAELWKQSIAPVSGCQATGTILQEVWNALPASSRGIGSIPVNTPPAVTSRLTSFETSPNRGDYYGERVRGYLCAPQTGNYTFWIASDNEGELWLSTDENPANKQKIASLTGYTKPREWTKYPSQQSATVYLTAGTRYYIEALHRELTLGDHLAVAWRTPAMHKTALPEIIPGAVLSPVTVPSAPTLFGFANSAKEAFLDWSADVILTAEQYQIERATAATGPYRIVLDLPANVSSVTDRDLKPNTTYYYRIRTANRYGFAPYSNVVSLTTPDGCIAEGSITRELWSGLPSTARGVGSIPILKTPTKITTLTSLETPTNQGDNYGERIRGYICMPESGVYTFWIASDNEGELWLSTDENPANKQKIASLTGYTRPREWTKFPSQQSEVLYLVAGQRYYIEVLHKEAGLGDNLAVGWQTPSMDWSLPPVVIPGKVLSPYTSVAAREAIAEEPVAITPAETLRATPNPFSQQTTVQFTATQPGRAQVQLFDLQGRLVQQLWEASVNAGDVQQVTVQGHALPQGLYLVRLTNGTHVSHLKLLVTH